MPSEPLPTESASGLRVEPAGEVVDWNRTVVARERGEFGHRTLAGLIGRSWLETRVRGFARVCGDFSAPVVRLLRAIGVRAEPLGPARRYWGEDRYPVRVDVEGSGSGLAAWLRPVAGPGPPG